MLKWRAFLFCGLLVLPALAEVNPPPAPEWPLKIEGARAPIVMYQPQPDTFEGNKLTGRAAVSIQPAGKDPVFGAVWIEARISTDRDSRVVTVEDVQVTRSRFAGATPEQEQMFSQILAEALTQKHFVISLDRLLVSLESAKSEMKSAEGLKTDPPKIYVEQTDAVLLVMDGAPQLRKMGDAGDQRVVNTPFELILTAQKQWRLKVGERWLVAPDLNGLWKDEVNLSSAAPKIIVSQEPAELIASKGEPAYSPLPGNDLLYMTNTESDVFVETASSKIFVLLSGRWYAAATLQGPWTFVRPDKLPAAFAKIPPASPKASVRSSVAGTDEANDAVMDAQIPQTAIVSHKDKDGKLQVTWDGEPKFGSLEGLTVAYSINASIPVFRVGTEGYWACTDGIWYASKKPEGPWVVANYVPKEIYKIPPSCPYYNCRYVHIYEAHDDVVYVGYYPGYVGCYPYYGTVYYGTGYYYSGWYGPAYYYPPPMMTYGFAFRYNPYSGWGVGVAWGMGGAGWVVVGGGGGPVYGWWGPGGYPGYGYGNRGPHIEHHDRGQNLYNRGDRGAHASTQPVGRERGPHAGTQPVSPDRGAHVDSRDRPASAGDRNKDVYTDRDGNLSRRNDNGTWQNQAGNSWTDAVAPKQDVQRDSQARDRGAQRTSQYQSTSRPSNSGSYSGGGARGGGGMRGGGGGRR